MSTVKVTFTFDGSDDEDSTGLTEEEFIELSDAIAQLGGYDVEVKKQPEAS